MSGLVFRRDADGKPLWHAPLPNPAWDAGDKSAPMWGPCQLCGEPWPCAEARYDSARIMVSGIWLRAGEGDFDVEVLAEIDGEWRTVIVERHEPGHPLSHIVEPLGMRHAVPDRLRP